MEPILPCEYVTIWDGGSTLIRTSALYNTETKTVSTDAVDVEGLDILGEEYIEFPNGTRIDRFDDDDEENFIVY